MINRNNHPCCSRTTAPRQISRPWSEVVPRPPKAAAFGLTDATVLQGLQAGQRQSLRLNIDSGHRAAGKKR